jgi:hypothetical protein
LHDAERKRRDRRKGVNLDDRRGVEQWGKRHELISAGALRATR